MYSKLYLAPFVDATLRNVSSVVSQPTRTVYDPHPPCDFHRPICPKSLTRLTSGGLERIADGEVESEGFAE